MLDLNHIDEIQNDDATQIAQPQLAAYGGGGL